jgi:hypothetical protein
MCKIDGVTWRVFEFVRYKKKSDQKTATLPKRGCHRLVENCSDWFSNLSTVEIILVNIILVIKNVSEQD